jgi:hypothetical protein
MRSGTVIAWTALWGLATASVALAQDDPVVETFTGAVIKTDDSVESGTIEKLASGAVRVTRADTIVVVILADQIKEIRKLRTVLDDFDDRYKQLDRTQAKSFWDLADWCGGQQAEARNAQYHDKLKEKEIAVLEELVKGFKGSEDPTSNAYAVAAEPRLKLLTGKTEVTPPPPPPPGTEGAGLEEPKPATLDEIQQIRWAEWKPSDSARPMIPRKLLDKYGLLATPPAEQFALLRNQQLTDEERKQVRFLSDVDVLRTFKTKINRILVRSCATPSCHGGADARKWRMINKGQLTTPEQYANFKALQPYVNRDYAANSPLLKAGLKYDPLDRTGITGIKDHPPSMAAKPIWADASEADYRTLLGWISDLKFQPGSGPPPLLLPPPGDEPIPPPPGGPLDPPPLP